MQFINLQNDFVEEVSGPLSWLWVLLFGPLYWAAQGIWRHFWIHLILALATFGVVHLIYPFLTYRIIEGHYLRNGWRPYNDDNSQNFSDKSAENSNGPNAQPLRRQTRNNSGLLLAAAAAFFIGLTAGYWVLSSQLFSEPDPSEEIEEIIERKMREREKNEEAEREINKEQETKLKEEPVFMTPYYEFPGAFTTNLRNSRKMLQIRLGVSSDEGVPKGVEEHQLALRSVILGVISDFSEDDVKGATGRDKLARALRDAINKKLEALENFGVVKDVHFTSFVLQ